MLEDLCRCKSSRVSTPLQPIFEKRAVLFGGSDAFFAATFAGFYGSAVLGAMTASNCDACLRLLQGLKPGFVTEQLLPLAILRVWT